MLKIKRKQKIYDFKYKIFWKDGKITNGNINNSILPPEEIFLTNAFTYFAKGTCTYFDKTEIKYLEVYDLVEKIED